MTAWSNKWIFADPAGELGAVGAFRRVPSVGVAPAEERADGMVPVEQEVLSMRRIPWQTPHSFDKEGKLVLTETGQEWLDKVVKRREKLAEEVRAESGESSFLVEAPIRRMWVKDQELDKELLGWFKAADDEVDQAFRRHPVDGCLEK